MEENLHEQLLNLIGKYFGSPGNVPNHLKGFIQEINDNYHDFECKNRLLQDAVKVHDEVEELSNNEQYLMNALMNNIPDHIYFKDLESRFIRISRSHAQSFGLCDPRKVIGKTDFDFFTEEHAQQAFEDEQKIILSGEPINLEEKQTWSDRQNSWVSTTKIPLRDKRGKIIGTFGISKDITKRKEAEESLLNERALFRTIIDLIPDAVYVKDSEGRKVLANPKEVQFAGKKTEEEVIGQSDFDLYPDEAAQHALAEDRMVIQTEQSILDVGGQLIDKEGILHWLQISKVPLRDISGKVTGLVGVTRDVTDQKKIEQALVKAKQEAEMSNKFKSIFLANMSHEIRTPLNAIIGFSQLMSRDKLLSDQQKEYNVSIIHAGEHLLALINDILELSKIEAGRVVLSPSNVELYTLIDDVQMIFKERVLSKNLQFICEKAADLPRYVFIDESKLRQIFVNLIGNALKFTDKGGIAVHSRVQKTGDGKEMLTVEIQDSGPGIPEDEIGKLFKHFEQTSSGISKGSGTGLGLALSRELAILMGGDITVSSEVGKGTLFTFQVEIKKGNSKALEKNSSRRVIGMEKGEMTFRILVVDDKHDNLRVATTLLKLVGFETNEALNGEEAIAKFESWNPHLVLMDMRMPVMDGYEATRRIKLTDKGRQTPVIALTASIFEDELKKIDTLGMQGYISKPFRESELFKKIGQILGIKYIYENEQIPSPTKYLNQDGTIEKDIVKIPNGQLLKMQNALAVADLDLLVTLIDGLKIDYSEVANHLGNLAANYDYDQLQRLLYAKAK